MMSKNLFPKNHKDPRKNPFWVEGYSGEYRSRTDDLLRARQAL